MAENSAAAALGTTPRLAARLEPDAIGVTQDTVIGMASSAPAASVGLTLAALAAAAAYGSGAIIIVTAIPMLIIANAYRRLNLWKANCGASFEWVGRAISPDLGFMTGWLMIAAYIIATVSGVEVLGPSVLGVFGASSTNTWGNIGIATAVGLVMLIIAVIGIKITARTQVGMAAVEYAILIGFAIAGLVAVLGHHPGTLAISSGWFSLTGIGGKGGVVAGFLSAVFIFTGWDGTVYVNEEVTRRRINPGRAAVMAVLLLTVIYTLSQVGLQGAVSPGKLAAAGQNGVALTAVAQALGGSGWAKVMALGLALSVIATTGTGIVLTARVVYGMASQRTLPTFLATVSRRFSTPVAASLIVGFLIVALAWVYLLTTTVQGAFNDVVAVTGLLFAVFYVLTVLATMTYYRRRILKNAWDAISLGVLPLCAAGFLVWMVEQYLQTVATASQVWSLIGIFALGLILLLVARFVLRSPFFTMPRESDPDTGAA
ncbi:MAG TPA: APC family permease [Streptosporangiaceae bacterium]|nr:APC family permease [Streptosporangiaceae bacterium]HUC27712.1 APC family permease [Streptosporangiaceae bacterium]